MPLDQQDIDMGYNTGSDQMFLVSPVVVEHVIDEKSPLWQYSKQDIESKQIGIRGDFTAILTRQI